MYNEYTDIIQKMFISLENNSFKRIDDYISNIMNYEDPVKESITTTEDILKINEQIYKYLNEIIQEYQKKIKDIRGKLIKNKIEVSFKNISFDNTIYKNFFSKKHVLEHGVWGVVSIVCFFLGPVVWSISIGIHAMIAIGNFTYDIYKTVDTIIENMQKFKKNLKLKFEGDKNDKILDNINKLKKIWTKK